MLDYIVSNFGLAQAQPAPNPIASLFPLILIFFIFYFMVIKPQRSRQKQHDRMLKNLKKNDYVVTNGGIHGTIVDIKDTAVVLKVDDNTKILVEKSAIAFLKKG